MTEYWFAYKGEEPTAVFRIVRDGNKSYPGEYFDFAQNAWMPSDRIERYISFGEIGYEKTTEFEADKFIQSRINHAAQLPKSPHPAG